MTHDTPGPEIPATFAPAEVVAGRFRIVRMIGWGGGGEVYEAEDLELHERVALKTVRMDIAHNEEAIRRFRREVQLARKVTHPNVCRIFDVFLTQRVDANHPDRKITFLTMELLEGQTLASRIEKKGRMTQEEALPVIRQVVDGLSAAHKSGIVHRDLKSENILLVPEQDGNTRAVIMDFGLAFSKEAYSASQAITRQGTILGTVAYMAPEQLEGQAVSATADIYALGVVMYEMVTGSLPFEGDSMVSTIARKLTMDPPSPRELVKEVDEQWEFVILRCLEKRPEDRFSSAAEVPAALEGEMSVPLRRQYRRRKEIVFTRAAILLILISLIAAALWRAGYLSSSSLMTGPKMRRSVAVLGFKNLSGQAEAQWLSTALAEMLTTELAAGEELRMISGENISRMKIDLKIPDSDTLARDSLSRIRANLNADFVVLGSYLRLGSGAAGQIRLDVRLQNTQSGETAITVTQSGTESALFDLVSKAGTRLREKLGISSVTPKASDQVRASLPANRQAIRQYSEGLDKLRKFDYIAAREFLQQAVAADPDFPQAHSFLAEVWEKLGFDEKALQEAKKAVDLSTLVSKEDRLMIEARYREFAGEDEKSSDLYRSLFTFYPDNLEYGLELVYSVAGQNKGQDAILVLQQLRSLSPPTSQDPRIDLAEAYMYEFSFSDHKRSLESANRAARKSLEDGANLLAAGAYLRIGLAYLRLGDLQQSRTAYETAQRIYQDAGDHFQAVDALNGIARVAGFQGDLKKAESAFRDVLAAADEVGNLSMQVTAWSNLAFTIWREGRLGEAQDAITKTLALEESLSDKSGIGYIRRTAGAILRDRGRLAEAQTGYEKWIAESRPTHHSSTAWLLYGQGLVFLDRNQIDHALAAENEALKMRIAMDEKGQMAESKQALALIDIEQEKFTDAQRITAEAAEYFRKQQPDDEAYSRMILARSLFSQGKVAEAQVEIAAAAPVLQKTQSFNKRISFEITAATVRAASEKATDLAAAIEALNRTIEETKKAGFPRLELEARLALYRLEIASGNSTLGRNHLAELERDARRTGFLLIASQASTALKSS